MRKYTIALVVVVVTPIIIIGVIVFKNVSCKYFRKEVFLHTSIITAADSAVVNPFYGPELIAAFYCHKKNDHKNPIPWADVFVCLYRPKMESSKVDTILFLDTGLRKNSEPKDPGIYWTGVKETKRFPVCRIAIPGKEIPLIKRYKYKYASVILVTDD